ncbi:hypothetical protein BpHYR1_052128 [Brachionus plicatilis]|uniref:Uncharacterized protein n=1 Tax=Brachionus plicatilis TaxID=10195 RepID=A0A3M7RX50_BRAPC|nr:hypothetical protein BpHYR1_052128 [Brachionus plicatilis]
MGSENSKLSKTLLHVVSLNLNMTPPPKDLKLHRVDNRLFDLGENYIRRSLQKQVPLTCRLVNEFKLNFESRDITYPTPLCGYYLIIDQLYPLIQTPVLSNF